MINEPLANKLRPKNLNDIVGQHELLDKNKPVRNIIENKEPISFIFYGPPGTGKTTLANIIAKEWNLPFESFNASIDNKATLQKLVKKHNNNNVKESFILLLDEIHRLTKPIQDFLLPYTENGQIILIGATTENPFINISPAIRSRCAIFQVRPVNEHDIYLNLKRITKKLKKNINDASLKAIAKISNGDVRNSINLFSTLFNMYKNDLSEKNVKEYAKNQKIVFDKNGDLHYNVISALQKSIRGFDTDAALYYTGIMCESGDLETLIRRLIVIAYEDIGLADSNIVQKAVTALITCKDLGLPEARIPISNAVILLCNAPHSNSAYQALDNAIKDAKNYQKYGIPNDLKDTHYKGANKLNAGLNYKYPHDYPNDWTPQQYLPDALIHKTYYHYHNNKEENKINNYYQTLKKAQLKGLNKL